jgi:glycosyltransferase involved in cell wall biosynthesis
VYNTEKTSLDKCINSILNQTFSDYEIVLVDDGSESETAFICDEYEKKYKRISVIHQNNMGLAGARNTGIDNAKGDWLIHIDSDDWIDNNLLELVAAKILESNAEIIFWGYRTCKGSKETEYLLKNKKIMERPYEEQKDSIIESIMLANREYDYVALNTTWAKAFNRRFVLDNNIRFNIELKRSQDVIYNLYAFDAAHNVAYIDTAASNYRTDNISLSRGYNNKTLERLTKTANACLEFADLHPEKPDYKMAALSFCRRCFRIIVIQDFMNDSNKQPRKIKKRRLKETLLIEPFNIAFSKEAMRAKADRDKFATYLTAGGRYYALEIYWKFRDLLRKIKW